MIIVGLFADRWVTGSQGQLHGGLVDCYTLAYLAVARSSLPIGRLFRLAPNTTSKPALLTLYDRNTWVIDGFPAQGDSDAERVLCHAVFMIVSTCNKDVGWRKAEKTLNI